MNDLNFARSDSACRLTRLRASPTFSTIPSGSNSRWTVTNVRVRSVGDEVHAPALVAPPTAAQATFWSGTCSRISASHSRRTPAISAIQCRLVSSTSADDAAHELQEHHRTGPAGCMRCGRARPLRRTSRPSSSSAVSFAPFCAVHHSLPTRGAAIPRASCVSPRPGSMRRAPAAPGAGHRERHGQERGRLTASRRPIQSSMLGCSRRYSSWACTDISAAPQTVRGVGVDALDHLAGGRVAGERLRGPGRAARRGARGRTSRSRQHPPRTARDRAGCWPPARSASWPRSAGATRGRTPGDRPARRRPVVPRPRIVSPREQHRVGGHEVAVGVTRVPRRRPPRRARDRRRGSPHPAPRRRARGRMPAPARR